MRAWEDALDAAEIDAERRILTTADFENECAVIAMLPAREWQFRMLALSGPWSTGFIEEITGEMIEVDLDVLRYVAVRRIAKKKRADNDKLKGWPERIHPELDGCEWN